MTQISLIETKNLKKYFKTPKGFLHAVDNINLKIQKGKTLGVVGESGCGKSTLGRTILRLLEPTFGDILYEGQSICGYTKKEMKEVRKNLQIIFQDPFSSLNPRMTVAQTISEPIKMTGMIKDKKAIEKKTFELMETVGLAERFVNAYPHELDGGRRQRIGIARALSLNPKFIVCDEPVSALDVSIQAQILNLLMDLQESKGIAYMFITHDLSVVKHISDEIMVMYLGNCIERGSADSLFKNPLHPYTKALLHAIPIPRLIKDKKLHDLIQGEVTSPINPQEGCRFAVRCPYSTEICTHKNFSLVEVHPNHFVACGLYENQDKSSL